MTSIQVYSAPHIFNYGTPFGIITNYEEQNRTCTEAYLVIVDLPKHQIKKAESIRFCRSQNEEQAEVDMYAHSPQELALEWLQGEIQDIRFKVYQSYQHFPKIEHSDLRLAQRSVLYHFWFTGSAQNLYPRLKRISKSTQFIELLQRIMNSPICSIEQEELI
ncbi:hypothetical protein [Gimesia maris]|uniref:hypothetical protein n=1 Tax=Gimesia maris TaxID=122 RepID=UPI0032EFFB54